MLELLSDDARRLAPPRSRANSSHAASFPKKRGLIRGNFRHFLCAPEPVKGIGVCYRGTAHADKMQTSIRPFPTALSRSDFK
jgi:hypothetical protein